MFYVTGFFLLHLFGNFLIRIFVFPVGSSLFVIVFPGQAHKFGAYEHHPQNEDLVHEFRIELPDDHTGNLRISQFYKEIHHAIAPEIACGAVIIDQIEGRGNHQADDRDH